MNPGSTLPQIASLKPRHRLFLFSLFFFSSFCFFFFVSFFWFFFSFLLCFFWFFFFIFILVFSLFRFSSSFNSFFPGPVGPGAAAGGRLLLRGAPEAGAPDPSLRGEASVGNERLTPY